MSYLPMAHCTERLTLHFFAKYGGTIGFFSGKLESLQQDLLSLKPSIFSGVPRLFNMYYNIINKNFSKLEGSNSSNKAIEAKMKNLKENKSSNDLLWDKLVFSNIKSAFGGNTRLMVSSSSNLSAKIFEFLKIVSNCPIYEQYGLSESSGPAFITIHYGSIDKIVLNLFIFK